MKKRIVNILTVASLLITGLVAGSVYAKGFQKDPTKAYHVQTLLGANISSNETNIDFMNVLKNDKGEKWIYTSYLSTAAIEDMMEQKYTADVKESFGLIQERIMDDLAKIGDTEPVILVNEELTEGKFMFIRDKGKGKLVSVDITLKDGQWIMKR